MKKFLLSGAVLCGAVLSLNVAYADDVGEVMGGSHQPPARVWRTSRSQSVPLRESGTWAEDNASMTIASSPYRYQSQYQYVGYDGSPVYYGYYDWYGYWHNYADEFGYPMYYWNGSYYYY